MLKDGRFYELGEREQLRFVAWSLRQAVEREADVLALDEAVEGLDSSALEERYRRVGHPAYPPKVMLKVLIYAYAIGLRASREIERLCRLDDRFRFLAHGLAPDYSTLCRFRHDHPEALKEIFCQTVRRCQEAGLVSLGQVAIDGSKIRANRRGERLRRAKEFVEEALAEAEAADCEAPVLPEADSPGRAEQECRLMKTPDGIKAAYNAQLAVDAAAQVIVAQDLVAAENDSGQLPALVKQVRENCQASPEAVSADGGYLSKESLEEVEAQGVKAYLPLPARGAEKFAWEQAAGGFRCQAGHLLGAYRRREGRQIYRTHRCRGCLYAAGCGVKGRFKEISLPLPQTPLGRLARRMKTAKGQAIYAARKQIVEPVFGHFKHNRGFRRFLLRGRRRAGAEWSLLCIGHNLRLLAKAARAACRPGKRLARVGNAQGLAQLCRTLFAFLAILPKVSFLHRRNFCPRGIRPRPAHLAA